VSALKRRKRILYALNSRRQETLENLAKEFNVSKMTIRRDIDELSGCYPIYTEQGKGGGIRVMEGFQANKEYINTEQTQLLKRILPTLDGKDAQLMEELLERFAMPDKPKKRVI